MRVLTTNCSLRGRSGTEVVTIDLALGLRRRGHEVCVLTPMPGASAEILKRHDIIVTDDPAKIPWPPDVIHGHHNHVLTAALAACPKAPALFVSHSSNFWFDGPPALPRVRKLCAVDEACRARVAADTGRSNDEITLLLNAVDTDLFEPRAPLPAKPVRALLLAKNNAHADAVRAAASKAGVALDEIGSAFGNEADDLHERLKSYDLVFATARMALEALTVGCAVVVVDGRGLAGLVTSSVVDDWRARNFGLSLLTRQPTPETISAEIARYDAADAALAALRIRETASLSAYLDQVEAVHRDLLADPFVVDAVDDLRATGAFITDWLRRLGEGMIPENFDTLQAANKFATEHQGVVADNATLRQQLAQLQARADLLTEDHLQQQQTLEARIAAREQDNLTLRQAFDDELRTLRDEYAMLKQTLETTIAGVQAENAELDSILQSPLATLRHHAGAWRERLFRRK